MNYKDIEVMNQAFGNLNQTLMENRRMSEEKKRYANEQERMGQASATQQSQFAQEQAFKEKEFAERVKESGEKSKNVFYITDPESGNSIQSMYGTPEEAQAEADSHSKKFGKPMVITDKIGENKIKVDYTNESGNKTNAYMSPKDAAMYSLGMAKVNKFKTDPNIIAIDEMDIDDSQKEELKLAYIKHKSEFAPRTQTGFEEEAEIPNPNAGMPGQPLTIKVKKTRTPTGAGTPPPAPDVSLPSADASPWSPFNPGGLTAGGVPVEQKTLGELFPFTETPETSQTPKVREAFGGYKINSKYKHTDGKVYKYLGGDHNDESSWEKSE